MQWRMDAEPDDLGKAQRGEAEESRPQRSAAKAVQSPAPTQRACAATARPDRQQSRPRGSATGFASPKRQDRAVDGFMAVTTRPAARPHRHRWRPAPEWARSTAWHRQATRPPAPPARRSRRGLPPRITAGFRPPRPRPAMHRRGVIDKNRSIGRRREPASGSGPAGSAPRTEPAAAAPPRTGESAAGLSGPAPLG